MKKFPLITIVSVCLLGKVWAQPAAPAPGSSTAPSAMSASRPPVISPEEWQELRTARTEAMQSNPEMIAHSKMLMEKMQAFQDKLDAAMIKIDPSIAPTITKFEAGRHRPTGAPVPPPPGVK